MYDIQYSKQYMCTIQNVHVYDPHNVPYVPYKCTHKCSSFYVDVTYIPDSTFTIMWNQRSVQRVVGGGSVR